MDIQKLATACEKNGFEFIFVQTKQEALEIVKKHITPNVSVGIGGSTTLEETGIQGYLIGRKDIKLFNQYEAGITMNENIRRRREGMIADIYISSTNAITKKGELVNSDGTGNRVAAQIFGSKKLFIVAGVNKIVEDVTAAIHRIKTVAAVKNVERLNAKAVSFGKAPSYTVENIANKYGIIENDEKGRTTIILVNESLGY
ncbi:MAG: lactate utilization protein [Campylobacteraceae bacterium]